MLSSGNKQPMPTPFPPISMVPTAQMPQEIFPSSAQPEENQEKTLKKICKGKGKNEYPPLLKRGDQGQYESMTKRVEKVRLSDLKPVLEELHAVTYLPSSLHRINESHIPPPARKSEEEPTTSGENYSLDMRKLEEIAKRSL